VLELGVTMRWSGGAAEPKPAPRLGELASTGDGRTAAGRCAMLTSDSCLLILFWSDASPLLSAGSPCDDCAVRNMSRYALKLCVHNFLFYVFSVSVFKAAPTSS
jgi:hypothetical protein